MQAIQTDWKLFNGGKSRIRARFGFHRIGNQDPYFSVTGEIETRASGRARWCEDSFGCLHEEITKHFPKLRPLIRWHLSSVTGPMHYEANSLFWWDHYVGALVPDKYARKLEGESNSEYGLRLFKDTCVFGPDDVLPPLSATHGEVREWLKARLPRLLETFKQDVLAAGLVWEEVES
jgi:hypothetical protein